MHALIVACHRMSVQNQKGAQFFDMFRACHKVANRVSIQPVNKTIMGKHNAYNKENNSLF